MSCSQNYELNMVNSETSSNNIEFIALDRRFRHLNLSGDQENAAFDSYTSGLFTNHDHHLSWSDLLSEDLVVILGEPGSGKTWELREQTKLLCNAGKFAFFIRLDAVLGRGIRATFTIEEQTRFDKWLTSRERGTLLLDSVDESKVRSHDDFANALELIRDKVGKARTRCSLIISSRISEWRPYLDQHEVLRLFPQQQNHPDQPSKGKESSDSPLKVVQILPLDHKQVKIFAQSRGVNDVDLFLEALDSQYAWEFARRPVDVTSLLNYWKHHGKLSTLSELVEFDITFKLSEMRDREFISAEQARLGAEMLAASVIFCRQFNIKISDDVHVPLESGLNPVLCLPQSWTAVTLRALLTRAVFDSACYGHQRFHHRRTAEYLAASWLNRLMREGCPTAVLEELLFKTAEGRRIIRPSVAPVTAWLANGKDPWNQHVREWILDAAPWLHLSLGDPTVLSIDYKRALLRAVVKRYHGRKQVIIDWSSDALNRFANPELAQEISGFISEQAVPEDIRCDLLMLVRHGRLTGCLDVVLEIIASPEATELLKIYAVATIRDVGEVNHRQQLASIVESWGALTERLCTPICEALYPVAVEEQGLLAILRKSAPPKNDSVGLRYYLEQHFNEKLLPARAGALLAGLIVFAKETPHIKNSQLSQRNHWVTGLFLGILLKLFECQRLNDEEISIAVDALHVFEDGLEHTGYRHHLDDKEKTSLTAAVSRHSDVRRAYFWSLVGNWRHTHQENPQYLFQLFDYYSVLNLTAEDVSWLLSDVQDHHQQMDKELALSLALNFVWPTTGLFRRVLFLSQTRSLVKSTPGLKPFFWREAKKLVLQPTVALWFRIRHRLTNKYWWKNKFYAARNRFNKWRDKITLMRHLAWLRKAKRVDWLVNLSHEAEENKSLSRYSPSNWNGLTKKYGRLITKATRQGCEFHWPLYWPPLPHEKSPPSDNTYETIVGLCGLQSLVEEQKINFATLDHKDAERAARYALNEINGFPDWFPELALRQPNAVKLVLAEAIEGEWQYPVDREHVHDIVSRLVWNGDFLWDLICDKLACCFRAGDPPHHEIFSTVLTLVFKTKALSNKEIAELAQSRILNYKKTSVHYSLWLSTWIQSEADKALTYIEKLLSKLSLLDADQLILQLCANLSSDRYGQTPQMVDPEYAETQQLLRFIKIVYQHVRPAEDIDRANGVGYSPTSRDDVQRFRSSLLEKLVSYKDLSPDNVHELLSIEELTSSKDWIMHLMEKRAERLADAPPWREKDVREFSREFEITPRTDHDLFRIACHRLSDIKREVEDSENSPRAEVQKEWHEPELRTWFQRKLRGISRNRYTIPQEAEIDMGKKPDLRFEYAGVDGAVSVELKWAENWSYNELVERLENQLVGQYLRAHNARYGIYLLGYIDRKPSVWKGTDGTNLDFSSLIATIKDHARILQQSRPDIEEIKVIGINFLPPYGEKCLAGHPK